MNTTSIQIPEYILVLDTFSFGQDLYITNYLPLDLNLIEECFSEQIQTKVVSEKRTNQRGEFFLLVKEERSLGGLVLDSKESKDSNETILGLALEEYITKSNWEEDWLKDSELKHFYHRVRFLVNFGVLDLNVEPTHLKQTAKEWLFPFINFDSGKLSLDKLPFWKHSKPMLVMKD